MNAIRSDQSRKPRNAVGHDVAGTAAVLGATRQLLFPQADGEGARSRNASLGRCVSRRVVGSSVGIVLDDIVEGVPFRERSSERSGVELVEALPGAKCERTGALALCDLDRARELCLDLLSLRAERGEELLRAAAASRAPRAGLRRLIVSASSAVGEAGLGRSRRSRAPRAGFA